MRARPCCTSRRLLRLLLLRLLLLCHAPPLLLLLLLLLLLAWVDACCPELLLSPQLPLLCRRHAALLERQRLPPCRLIITAMAATTATPGPLPLLLLLLLLLPRLFCFERLCFCARVDGGSDAGHVNGPRAAQAPGWDRRLLTGGERRGWGGGGGNVCQRVQRH